MKKTIYFLLKSWLNETPAYTKDNSKNWMVPTGISFMFLLSASRPIKIHRSYAWLRHLLKIHHQASCVCAKFSQTSGTFVLFSYGNSFRLGCFGNFVMIKFTTDRLRNKYFTRTNGKWKTPAQNSLRCCFEDMHSSSARSVSLVYLVPLSIIIFPVSYQQAIGSHQQLYNVQSCLSHSVHLLPQFTAVQT